MSGGIAYVLDDDDSFENKCNKGLVGLEQPKDKDFEELKELIKNHYQFTKSEKAKYILDHFENFKLKFIKVIPHDFKRILESKKEKRQEKIVA
jgi:glutamate synthase domain-containing protein 3